MTPQLSQYDSTIQELMREIQKIKEEQKRIAAQTKLFQILNVNTPAQITANQNDYDPGDYDLLLISSDAARNITGISGGVQGRVLYLHNVGAFNITLVYGSALSIATNRILTPGHINHVMTPPATGTRTRAMLIYHTSRWYLFFESAP